MRVENTLGRRPSSAIHQIPRNSWLLFPLVTGSLLPLAQPLGGDSLLISDVLGDVGEGFEALPQSDRPAGEKDGQRTTDQEDRQGLQEGSRPYHGKDRPDADEDDASNPDDDQYRRPCS